MNSEHSSIHGENADNFLSKQVEASAYYFLKMTEKPSRPLMVVCGGRERCRSDYRVRRDGFRYHCIEFVVEGGGELMLGGKRYPLGPGVAFAYGPGVPHRITSDPSAPMTKYFVDFTGRRAALFGRSLPCASAPVQVSDTARVRDVYEDLDRSAREGGVCGNDICALLLQVLAARLGNLAIKGRSLHGRALETFRRCRAKIDEEYVRFASLDDAASACHVAPEYLCRLFRRFAGTTPYDYMQRKRMDDAADLLQNSGLMIKEVAQRLDYSDAFHFSRTFKRVHGVSPRRFMELNRRQ